MLRTPTLTEYFRDRYALERPLRPSSLWMHRHSLEIYIRWLGRDPSISDVDSESISRFVRDMGGRYAPRTVKRMRNNVLGTVRHAALAGLARVPGVTRPVKVPPQIPIAWTIDQVRGLLNATPQLRYHGAYLDRFLRAGWDTGLRRSDLEQMDMEQVDGSGRGVLRQSKTLQPVRFTLRDKTMKSLRRSGQRWPLRCPIAHRQIYVWWEKLCRLASVPHGGPQRLRRSAATYCELAYRGSATGFLGHRSPELAVRHYLDQRILQQDLPRPPALE